MSLTDSGIHAPPTTGTYDYNTFTLGAAGFPAVGSSYTDPIFNESIRRLTNKGDIINDDDIYGHHWVNANGTYFFDSLSGSGNLTIRRISDGSAAWTTQPVGTIQFAKGNVGWHPTNPDKYIYLDTTGIGERTLSTQTSVTIATSPGGSIQHNGGSLSCIDGTGDYYIVSIGGLTRLWKRSTNTWYAGAPSNFIAGNGWIGLTPDGNYIVTSAGSSARPQKEHWSFAVNHGTQTVSTTPVQFWGLGGDHGALVSASNGHNYFIGFDDSYNPAIYRSDITVSVVGMNETQQHASSQLLVQLAFTNPGPDGHLSGSISGTNRDWIAMDQECFIDAYNGGVSGWTVYRQEIMVVNVLTGEIRRMAHHRSRGLTNAGVGYYSQPHISTSWDGSVLLWSSNYNQSGRVAGYCDQYAIVNAFGSGDTTPPAAPTGLRIS